MHLAGAREHSGAEDVGTDPLANVTDSSDYKDENDEYIQNIV